MMLVVLCDFNVGFPIYMLKIASVSRLSTQKYVDTYPTHCTLSPNDQCAYPPENATLRDYRETYHKLV